MNYSPSNSQHGFTLIELITVIAIMSILIAISYPMYTKHVIKTHRSEAKIALFSMAASMERYAVLNHSYNGATLSQLEMDKNTENGYYQLNIRHASQGGYQLEAIPQNAQRKDYDCATLSLDDIGRKSISGNGCVEECW